MYNQTEEVQPTD